MNGKKREDTISAKLKLYYILLQLDAGEWTRNELALATLLVRDRDVQAHLEKVKRAALN